MAESWPDHSAELARKAIESLEHAADALGQGLISKRELDLVLRYQVDTIQGLVPGEIVNILIRAREELK